MGFSTVFLEGVARVKPIVYIAFRTKLDSRLEAFSVIFFSCFKNIENSSVVVYLWQVPFLLALESFTNKMLRGIIFNMVYLGSPLLVFKCFSLTKKSVFILSKWLFLLPVSYCLSDTSV